MPRWRITAATPAPSTTRSRASRQGTASSGGTAVPSTATPTGRPPPSGGTTGGPQRDPAAIHAKEVDDGGRRVIRNGYHNIGAENRARHDDADAKRLTRGEPARVAVDREVVNRDNRRASDAA